MGSHKSDESRSRSRHKSRRRDKYKEIAFENRKERDRSRHSYRHSESRHSYRHSDKYDECKYNNSRNHNRNESRREQKQEDDDKSMVMFMGTPGSSIGKRNNKEDRTPYISQKQTPLMNEKSMTPLRKMENWENKVQESNEVYKAFEWEDMN